MGKREDAARALRAASLKNGAAPKAGGPLRMDEHRRSRPHAWPAPPRTRSSMGYGSIIACMSIAGFAGPMASAGWGLSWTHAALCALIVLAISFCAASIGSTLAADEASRHGRAFHKACVKAFCSIEPGSLEASAAASALEAYSRNWCRDPRDAKRCESAAREALAMLRQSGNMPSAEQARAALALANANLRAMGAQEKIGKLSQK